MFPLPKPTFPNPAHTLAYLAGFVDGEGCIRIACNRSNVKRGASPHFRVVMLVNQRADHAEPLQLLYQMFGGWLGKGSTRKGCKPIASWQAHGKVAVNAIQLMLPYLKVKRAPAMAALAFHHWKEVMQTSRKAGTKVSLFELETAEKFTQLFYELNGNKPLEESGAVARPQ